MRIAILGTRGIPARYGGFETFAEKLSVGLAFRGIDVTVYCEDDGEERIAELQGVKLRYCVAPSLGSLQTILYDLKCLWSARRGFDVVYMLGYGAAPFCVIPRIWGAEVWINPDGVEWARTKWSRLAKAYFRVMEWLSIRMADRIIADANAIAAFLESRHGKLPACTVIPYGCEIVANPPSVYPLSEWNLAPGGYYLVVCRLEPENHVLEILDAFQQSSSERPLVVVGNHHVQTEYVARLRSVEDPRIRLIGTLYDQAKLTSLRWYAFGYMHGHSVGGTNPSLLEAMGCGNLVFAHDNPFNRETLGRYGVFFSSAENLANAINGAESATADLLSLRAGAQSRAREEYSWPDIVDRYADLLSLSGCPRERTRK
jgi:glycosyltransferase involved in cell wall biosynthesis